jgi:glyoxylase-like metal-dependent hydrolase (beta-lactamase superfamily II)
MVRAVLISVNLGENMPTEIKAITQKNLMTENCYLVKTPTGYILFDTGFLKKRDDLVRELETAGCKPGNLKLIIVTYGYFDHVGNSAYLRETYDAKIAMQSGDSAMTESGDMFRGAKGLTVAIIRMMLPVVGMSRYDSFRSDIALDDGHRFYDEPPKAQSWQISSNARSVDVPNIGLGTRINAQWSTGAWRS